MVGESDCDVDVSFLVDDGGDFSLELELVLVSFASKHLLYQMINKCAWLFLGSFPLGYVRCIGASLQAGALFFHGSQLVQGRGYVLFVKCQFLYFIFAYLIEHSQMFGVGVNVVEQIKQDLVLSGEQNGCSALQNLIQKGVVFLLRF